MTGPSAVPRRWAHSRHPFIYEVNTWPWLTELSERAGTPVTLATVPDEDWDAIADMGFDAVWLMGVWQRSPAGVTVALANRDLVAAFTAALPDWGPDDVVGSPYCIRDYEVDARLGGRVGLAAARSALAARGVGLLLDFVPNHVAPDHGWTSSHPEYFVHGTSAELRAEPASFMDVGGAVLANGRDPYSPAWPDVVQLDAFSTALREEMVNTLRDIASQCDGVRCDMAMLVMNDVFSSTWGDRVGDPPSEEYWPALIEAIHETSPDFTFIAEAYWDREADLQQQGFKFCYDKGLYDHLVADDVTAVHRNLTADAEFQSGLVRFVENHDEPRAASLFDSSREKAVTVAALTQTGARLVHHGQPRGRRVHLPVFLGRAPREPDDPELPSFFGKLLSALRANVFHDGAWSLCGVSGWPDDDSFEHLVAWCWDGDHRWLIVVNLSAAGVSGRVRVPWADTAGRTYQLSDPTTGLSVTRSGDDLRDGLHVALGAWEWHLFRVERADQDT